MTSTTCQDAVRLQTSVLSAAEKRLLVRIASRLPGWINSDHLTALGGLAMLGAGASYWLSARYPAALVLVVVCLAVNWFGDSLDGTVARVRHCQRPRYGFYVDHVLDTLGVLFLLAGLGLSGYMTPMMAAAVLAAYYLLSIEIYLTTVARRTFRMGFGMVAFFLVAAVRNARALYREEPLVKAPCPSACSENSVVRKAYGEGR